LCDKHALGKESAKVGDACKDDTECAGNMLCFMEYNKAKYEKKEGSTCTTGDECCSGTCSSGKCSKGICPVLNRNGYCTISGCVFANTLTIRTCPPGSNCNYFYGSGLCQKTCKLDAAASCRGNSPDLFGDYECRAYNNLLFDGGKFMQEPVCDFGPLLSCVSMKNLGKDCSALGDKSNKDSLNPTNMSCRDLLTGQETSDKFDPNGFCFDTTHSGEGFPTPGPGL